MEFINIDNLNELPIRTIAVKGSNEERGYQYGSQAKDLIHKSIQIYKEIVISLRGNGLTWERILLEVNFFVQGLKRYDRGLFDEMKGIAKGSGVQFEEVLFLNVRSEIMNPAWANAVIPEGCTSFLLQPCLTKNMEYFIGQTYDWFPTCQELLIVLHSEDEKGHEFITVTEAGIIGKIGCNNCGVGSLLNYLNNFEINQKGTPYNILLRRVLDSQSAYDAQRNIMRSPIAFGLNIFIADRKGFGINYELAANGIDFFNPENGLLIHTNHHLSNKLSIRTFNKKMYPSSKNRYDTAKKMLDKPQVKIEDIINLVSFHDKENSSNNICRHQKDDEYNMETIFTMIMELNKMELYLCFNTPCKNNFYRIALEKVFKTIRN